MSAIALTPRSKQDLTKLTKNQKKQFERAIAGLEQHTATALPGRFPQGTPSSVTRPHRLNGYTNTPVFACAFGAAERIVYSYEINKETKKCVCIIHAVLSNHEYDDLNTAMIARVKEQVRNGELISYIRRIADKDDGQMHIDGRHLQLTEEQRAVSEKLDMSAKPSIMILGRAGTGKTLLICKRMANILKQDPKQEIIYIAPTFRLRDQVKKIWEQDFASAFPTAKISFVNSNQHRDQLISSQEFEQWWQTWRDANKHIAGGLVEHDAQTIRREFAVADYYSPALEKVERHEISNLGTTEEEKGESAKYFYLDLQDSECTIPKKDRIALLLALHDCVVYLRKQKLRMRELQSANVRGMSGKAVAFIDELQIYNLNQIKHYRKHFADKQLILVGDYAQAEDPNHPLFKHLAKIFPGDSLQTETLSETQRSTLAINTATNFVRQTLIAVRGGDFTKNRDRDTCGSTVATGFSLITYSANVPETWVKPELGADTYIVIPQDFDPTNDEKVKELEQFFGKPYKELSVYLFKAHSLAGLSVKKMFVWQPDTDARLNNTPARKVLAKASDSKQQGRQRRNTVLTVADAQFTVVNEVVAALASTMLAMTRAEEELMVVLSSETKHKMQVLHQGFANVVQELERFAVKDESLPTSTMDEKSEEPTIQQSESDEWLNRFIQLFKAIADNDDVDELIQQTETLLSKLESEQVINAISTIDNDIMQAVKNKLKDDSPLRILYTSNHSKEPIANSSEPDIQIDTSFIKKELSHDSLVEIDMALPQQTSVVAQSLADDARPTFDQLFTYVLSSKMTPDGVVKMINIVSEQLVAEFVNLAPGSDSHKNNKKKKKKKKKKQKDGGHVSLPIKLLEQAYIISNVITILNELKFVRLKESIKCFEVIEDFGNNYYRLYVSNDSKDKELRQLRTDHIELLNYWFQSGDFNSLYDYCETSFYILPLLEELPSETFLLFLLLNLGRLWKRDTMTPGKPVMDGTVALRLTQYYLDCVSLQEFDLHTLFRFRQYFTAMLQSTLKESAWPAILRWFVQGLLKNVIARVFNRTEDGLVLNEECSLDFTLCCIICDDLQNIEENLWFEKVGLRSLAELKQLYAIFAEKFNAPQAFILSTTDYSNRVNIYNMRDAFLRGHLNILEQTCHAITGHFNLDKLDTIQLARIFDTLDVCYVYFRDQLMQARGADLIAQCYVRLIWLNQQANGQSFTLFANRNQRDDDETDRQFLKLISMRSELVACFDLNEIEVTNKKDYVSLFDELAALEDTRVKHAILKVLLIKIAKSAVFSSKEEKREQILGIINKYRELIAIPEFQLLIDIDSIQAYVQFQLQVLLTETDSRILRELASSFKADLIYLTRVVPKHYLTLPEFLKLYTYMAAVFLNESNLDVVLEELNLSAYREFFDILRFALVAWQNKKIELEEFKLITSILEYANEEKVNIPIFMSHFTLAVNYPGNAGGYAVITNFSEYQPSQIRRLTDCILKTVEELKSTSFKKIFPLIAKLRSLNTTNTPNTPTSNTHLVSYKSSTAAPASASASGADAAAAFSDDGSDFKAVESAKAGSPRQYTPN